MASGHVLARRPRGRGRPAAVGLAAAVAVAGLAAVAGCAKPTVFECADATACDQGAGGVCQPDGLCSYGDPACESGQRYGERAGDRSGTCVGADAPDGGGEPDRSIRALALGADHLCVLLADGRVHCTGDNGSGQLGIGDLAVASATDYRKVASDVDFAGPLVGGARHVCAAVGDGRAYCWGGNDLSQLGSISDAALEAAPVLTVSATAPATLVALAAGDAFSCYVIDSLLRCWGENDQGQLGPAGGGAVSAAPVLVVLPGTPIAVEAGGKHACAIVDGGEGEGRVWCWGLDEAGQATDSPGPVASPTVVSLPEGAAQAVAREVGLGEAFSCARSDAGVHCWGENGLGQLGDTVVGPDPGSHKVDQLPAPPLALAVGRNHACALLEGGELRCWGDNSAGQIAAGAPAVVSTPIVHPLAAAPTAIFAGADRTCALHADGCATCWGSGLVEEPICF